MFLSIPPEPTPKSQSVWREERVSTYKFIDDCVNVAKVCYENAPTFNLEGRQTRTKTAVALQNMFRSITHQAESKGMVVNVTKTNILCVSDAMSYSPVAHIHDASGVKISSSEETTKILGFTFGPRPSVAYHVLEIRKKIRRRYWTLINLRGRGFSEAELVQVYTTFIRPLADYCDVVYHSQLTDEQDELLEKLQVHALKLIFGAGISGRKLRELASVETLRERRIRRCDEFAHKCLQSETHSAWFPTKRASTRRSRSSELYLETTARCERLRLSPVHYMRRRLNGKRGKEYGERYRIYRQ